MSDRGSAQSARAPRPQVVKDSSALFDRMKRTVCREAPQLSPSKLLVTEDMVVEEVVKEVTVGDPNPVPRLGRILGSYMQQQQIPWSRKHSVTPGGRGKNRRAKGASGYEELEVSSKRKAISLEDDDLVEVMSPRFVKRHGPSPGRRRTRRSAPGYQSPMIFPEEYSDEGSWQSQTQRSRRPATATAPPAASCSRTQRPATCAGTRMNKPTQPTSQLWGGGPVSQRTQGHSPRPDTLSASFTSSQLFDDSDANPECDTMGRKPLKSMGLLYVDLLTPLVQETPSSYGLPTRPVSESARSRKPCTLSAENQGRQPLCLRDLSSDEISMESRRSSKTESQSTLDELDESFILSPVDLLHMTPRTRNEFLADFPDVPKMTEEWPNLSTLDTDLDIPDISYPPPPPRRNIGRLCCDTYPHDQTWPHFGSEYENYYSF